MASMTSRLNPPLMAEASSRMVGATPSMISGNPCGPGLDAQGVAERFLA
jgi:hypothetical protein